MFVYDTAKAKAESSTYEDLVSDRRKKRVLIRPPHNNQSLVASMIHNDGEEQAQAWCNGIVADMARAPKDGDIDQVAVHRREGEVAVRHRRFARMLSGDDDALKQSWPVQVLLPTRDTRQARRRLGRGVAKSAPNKDTPSVLEVDLAGAQAIFAAPISSTRCATAGRPPSSPPQAFRSG